MNENIKIRNLEEKDITDLQRHSDKPKERYLKYISEAQQGTRVVVVAELLGEAVAFCTLHLNSKYQPFYDEQIPEIVDLNVGLKHRRQGIARELITYLENWVLENGGKTIGIGVGMEPGYGSAQRLYVKMGYIPDGRGLAYDYTPVVYGKQYPADDDLVLFFTKDL